jgi:hypothetical protein
LPRQRSRHIKHVALSASFLDAATEVSAINSEFDRTDIASLFSFDVEMDLEFSDT